MYKKKITNDEIDLIEFFKIIYKQKKKIIIVTALAAIISFAHSVLRTPPNTEAILEIREISTLSELRYKTFNTYIYGSANLSLYPKIDLKFSDKNQSINNDNDNDKSTYNDKHKVNFVFGDKGLEALGNPSYYIINSNNLLDSFIKELNKVSLIENVVKKYDLIGKTINGNQQLESTFKESLLTFKIIDTEMKDDTVNLRISFQDKNTRNIKILLSYIEKYINDKIRKNILINFQTMISTQKKIDKFKIEDLQMRINKLKEIEEIQNERKLFFLKMQAQTARSLGIKKMQMDLTEGDIKVDISRMDSSLYYLRGYEVIEKEIELTKQMSSSIKNPDNREAETLNYRKQIIEQGVLIRRIEKSFLETPIIDQNSFYAAQIINSTLPDIYDSKIDLKNVWLAIILSLIVMMIYVLILTTIKKRR
ncbi:Wzz/FepE/Etk N-terminal domain-containing protein [Candidatus Pelagibacter ubique]|nr:Wzz/FepE/Etk N-terminal domain-containing protein [Candidatus Pelagibacter ubique]